MAELRIRCSSIGKIMTEPKSKSEGPLSVGAKSHIRELAAQDIFGVDFEVSDKKLEKGKAVEPDSLALLNRVRGLQLVKNTERRSNDWITGEADCFDPVRRRGHDLKSAWSLATFPICPEDVAGPQRTLYEWQMLGYCMLWDADEWSIDYALVDTPPHLIGFDPIELHVVSHIPEHMRLTSWTVRRDPEKEKAIAEKVAQARVYYAEVIREFERAHQAAAAVVLQAIAAQPAPTPAPAMPAVGHVPPRPMLPPAPPLAALVAAAPAPAPRPDEPSTLKLGTICERLGVTMTAAFLQDVLHVKPARVEGAARMYSEMQYALICRQLIAHVGAMAELYAGVEA